MGNIWVTGSRGQLGTELQELAAGEAGWLFTDLPETDICDEAACREFAREHRVSALINCAAYTAVDRAEGPDAELAERINATAAIGLARIAAEQGFPLIQLSTDYVFDGKSGVAYTETDTCRPLSVYGHSKRRAETGIRETGAAGIIIRTAWLHSPHGNNFVKTMLRLGRERSEIQVVSDQIGTPTSARHLAVAIRRILPQLEQGRYHGTVFHYTDEGVCSWYDLACAVMRHAGLSCRVRPIPGKAYAAAAARPHFSVLDKSRIRETFGVETPHWEEGLALTLQQLLP